MLIPWIRIWLGRYYFEAKMINVKMLISQLTSANIDYVGCNTERVWDKNGDITNRADVAALIAYNVENNTAFQLAENEAILRMTNARANAKAIPSWSSWTEADTLAWINTNIGVPLETGRTSLPATLTFATARAAFVTLLNIMDKMLVVLIALSRMVIAMRNQMWADLKDR